MDPRALAPTLADIANPGLEQPSIIIVVDDFNGTRGEAGVYFLDQREGTKLAALQSGATAAEVQALETSGQYSHGTLVFNHTLALLGGLDPNPEATSVRVFVPREETTLSLPVMTFGKLNISVVALDTEDFDTDVIAGRLEATIHTLSGEQTDTRMAQQRVSPRFTVNFSFGLVPCSVLADLKTAGSLTFEAYAREVLVANGLEADAFRDDLVNILTTPVGSDPLLSLMDSRGKNVAAAAEVSYIAAAGNYRMPYSLFPGYWSEFVSVSAMNMASDLPVKDPDYSNTGEVLLEGGYFTLTGYDPGTGGWSEYSNISVAGTSFAAPVLSVFTALDFTNPAPRCVRAAGDTASPLAFFKTETPVALPLPELDLSLATALNRYCGLE